MKFRSRTVAVALTLMNGCSGDFQTMTDTDFRQRVLPDGRVERWTVDEAELAHGEYRLETSSGWLLREGSFIHGQPNGLWTDWYAPEELTNGMAQRSMTYGFVAGLAEGVFKAWTEDGAIHWERSWAAGKPCGLWKEYRDTVRETSHPPCNELVRAELDRLALVSPIVNDFGWDGRSCPNGAVLMTGRDPDTGREAPAAYCARGESADGPAWWTRGEAGSVAQTGSFSMGTRTGTWVRYHPQASNAVSTGQRVAEAGSYAEGERQGTWYVYRADGTLESRGDYQDGLRQGTWETYAANLLRTSEGDYVAGQKTGIWREFHPDWPDPGIPGAGTIATEETWVEGVRHGSFTHWFRGGGKEREGSLREGIPNGVLRTWWENGEERFETTYVGGIASGPHRQWTEDGQLEAEGTYSFGRPEGAWTTWADPNFVILGFGGPARRTRQNTTFVDGVAQGTLTGHYEEEGTVALTAHLEDGRNQGLGAYYWPNGQILAEGAYQGGAAQGPWQTYYESGENLATWPYVDGVLSGPFVEYHENGQKKREGSYYAGQRSGMWTIWDQAGGVLQTEDCGPYGEACDCSSTESCQ